MYHVFFLGGGGLGWPAQSIARSIARAPASALQVNTLGHPPPCDQLFTLRKTTVTRWRCRGNTINNNIGGSINNQPTINHQTNTLWWRSSHHSVFSHLSCILITALPGIADGRIGRSPGREGYAWRAPELDRACGGDRGSNRDRDRASRRLALIACQDGLILLKSLKE
jgi:hypothetical protein